MATIEWRGKDGNVAYLSSKGVRRSLGKLGKAESQDKLRDFEQHLNGTHILFNIFTVDYIKWRSTAFPDSQDRIEQIIRQYLNPFFAQPIGGITEFDMERYKATRAAQGAATGTIIKELRTFMAIVNRAYKWGLIDANPIRDLEYPKQLDSKPIHFYTKEELCKLYTHSGELRWVWQFLANTGLRRTEYMNLKPEDIQQGHINITSTTKARTKSGKWRLIPLSPGAKEAMKHGYIYKGRRESLSRCFARCSNRAGLGGSLHNLRHTFCSHLVMSGVPLRTVQVLAGHSTVAITEKYAHLSPDYLTKSVEGLEL